MHTIAYIDSKLQPGFISLQLIYVHTIAYILQTIAYRYRLKGRVGAGYSDRGSI